MKSKVDGFVRIILIDETSNNVFLYKLRIQYRERNVDFSNFKAGEIFPGIRGFTFNEVTAPSLLWENIKIFGPIFAFSLFILLYASRKILEFPTIDTSWSQ